MDKTDAGRQAPIKNEHNPNLQAVRGAALPARTAGSLFAQGNSPQAAEELVRTTEGLLWIAVALMDAQRTPCPKPLKERPSSTSGPSTTKLSWPARRRRRRRELREAAGDQAPSERVDPKAGTAVRLSACSCCPSSCAIVPEPALCPCVCSCAVLYLATDATEATLVQSSAVS